MTKDAQHITTLIGIDSFGLVFNKILGEILAMSEKLSEANELPEGEMFNFRNELLREVCPACGEEDGRFGWEQIGVGTNRDSVFATLFQPRMTHNRLWKISENSFFSWLGSKEPKW